MMTSLRWILGYRRLEIWCKIAMADPRYGGLIRYSLQVEV